MENVLFSLEETLAKIDKRMNQNSSYESQTIQPVLKIAKEKGWILKDDKLESGINIFDGFMEKFSIKPEIEIQGILTEDEKTLIVQHQMDAQNELIDIIKQRNIPKNEIKNLIKMMTSDTIISSIKSFGLCYDWTTVFKYLKSGDIKTAEKISTRDWFLIRTLSYCFDARKIAKELNQTINEQSLSSARETLKCLFGAEQLGDVFPTDLTINNKNLQNKDIKDINNGMQQDLKKVEEIANIQKNEKQGPKITF